MFNSLREIFEIERFLYNSFFFFHVKVKVSINAIYINHAVRRFDSLIIEIQIKRADN